MTDRELLELAAKAAGIELQDDHYWSDGFWTRWNPLTDDGDALRLAVKLNFTVQVDGFDDDVDARRTYVMDTHGGCLSTERHESDPLAATRRAIVRAAAEIGRKL